MTDNVAGELRELRGGGVERLRPVPQVKRLDAVALEAYLSGFRLGAFDVPNDVALLPLPDGRCALIDATDWNLTARHSWTTAGFGKLPGSHVRRVDERSVSLHCLLMGPTDGLVVDHRNRLGLDNRRSNLRLATHRENSWNILRNKRDNQASLLLGVSRRGRLWVASLTHHCQVIEIGRFRTELEAGLAYDRECLRLRGEFAVLNFPDRV